MYRLLLYLRTWLMQEQLRRASLSLGSSLMMRPVRNIFVRVYIPSHADSRIPLGLGFRVFRVPQNRKSAKQHCQAVDTYMVGELNSYSQNGHYEKKFPYIDLGEFTGTLNNFPKIFSSTPTCVQNLKPCKQPYNPGFQFSFHVLFHLIP